METILIIDDDPSQLRMAEQAISHKLRYRAVTAGGGEDAIRWVLSGKQPCPDLLLLDLAMPGTGGLQVIRAVKAYRPHLPVIVLTQYGDDTQAAQAVQAGANDFLSKPIALERLRLSIHNALKIQRMSSTIARLERHNTGHVTFADIIGESEAIEHALAEAKEACAGAMPVLIQGEHGTGRKLMARAIHGSSGERAGKPFLAADCDSLTDASAEAMLFGQEKSPGKSEFVLGKLREADGGTLLLDNIGALSPILQHRLLEVLGDGVIRPTGASASIPVNIRIAATTAEPLEPLVAQGRFSHLLYQKLKAAAIRMPSLRERRGDIPLLAKHFISLYAAMEHKSLYGLTEQAQEYLVAGLWPGNVRQLSGLLWRAVILCHGDLIDAADMRAIQQLQPLRCSVRFDQSISAASPLLLDTQGRIKKLKLIEEEVIRFALRYSNGCMTRAARSLGIGRSTLYRRLNELGMENHISRANHTTRPMMKVSSTDRS